MSNFSLSRDQVYDNTDYWRQNTEADYVRCIQNLIASRPFGDLKFYIYSFVKRVDDVSGVKKMYHQPRLTRPIPLPGTTLMKVNPNDPGTATIIWTLPTEASLGLYQQGKMFADQFVYECVEKYLKNPRELVKKDPDDLSDDQAWEVYNGIKREALRKRNAKQRNEKI